MVEEAVLITGGSSGIGSAIAKKCNQNGFRVINLDKNQNPDVDTIECDFRDEESISSALQQVKQLGKITRLVNNVGAVFPNPVEEQSVGDFRDALELNTLSAVQCLHAVLPQMKQARFGRIVNISSRALLGKKDRSAYAASKGALLSLSRVWALELGQFGITSNVVAPGPIATELFARANPADSPTTKRIVDSIPVRRMGTPEDVAVATEFFLGQNSGFVNGQVLYVCGGITIGANQV